MIEKRTASDCPVGWPECPKESADGQGDPVRQHRAERTVNSGMPSVAPAFADPAVAVAFDRARLSAYLATQGLAYDATEPVRQFAGGLANRNYLISVDGWPVVLRRPPDGELPPGAHDMAREHAILSRLSKVLPFVPHGLHFCAAREVIGVPFQLIEYRQGLVVRGDDPENLIAEQPARAALCETLVDTLIRIHAVDPGSAGLDGLGRPEGFLERAVAGWAGRGLMVAGDSRGALIKDISAWLGRQRFQPRTPTLLHCDFKLDNLILGPEGLHPVAVVDWDMGTRGDPLFDLATLLSYWAEPGDPDCLRLLGQMPTSRPGYWRRADVVRHYAAVTGRPIDDLPAIHVLCLFKLGIVFLQLHGQWVSGAVADPRYASFRSTGEELLLLAETLTRDPGRMLQ
jgi:aminoglycoside phosphotransferase (APT) family kinase protein